MNIFNLFSNNNKFVSQNLETNLPAKNPNKGKVITDIFKDNEGNIIATEVATRIDTVDLLKTGLESQRKYLIAKRSEVRDLKTWEKFTDLIEKNQDAIEKHRELKGSWGSNLASRLAFKTLKDPKKEYAPILCNLRTHKVYDSNNQEMSSINRSASVTDFAHGEISLQELKDYKLLLKLRPENYDAKKHAHLASLYNIDKKNGLKKTLADMEERIIASYGSEKPLFLDKIIEERETVLKDLILQDLHAHFESSPPQGKAIFYGRVGLLNTNKDPVKEEGGLILHERTQALDMKAIYDQLQGVKVIFDGREKDGPFFDENGNIHMPQKFIQKNDGDQVKELNTLYFNVSVQKNTKNVGAQKLINDETFSKLESWKREGKLNEDTIQAMDQFYAIVNNHKVSAFHRADKAVEILGHLGLTSVNCFGGKDRTGYALATVTYRMLEKLVPESSETDKKQQKKRTVLMNRLARQLIKKDGVAIQVAEDCYGHKVLKLLKYNLPLYVPKSLQGSGLRIYESLSALGMKLKSAKGQSPEQVYAAPAA